MKTRILSGFLMLPLLIFVFWGGIPLAIACFLIGVMGVKEFFKCFNVSGINPSFNIALASAALLYSMYITTSAAEISAYIMPWLFISVIASMLYLFKFKERRLEDALVTITGIVYVIYFPLHVTLTEQTGDYGVLVWLIFLTAFGTDIMAYFTGYAFGKHKLAPNISPKKTIEGSIGGILGSVILCGVFGYFVVPDIMLHCLVIGGMGGIISQLGDLTASIFKRKLGVKDYGNLIPGHGGILDRFDSVLFTAPMVYYYISLVLI